MSVKLYTPDDNVIVHQAKVDFRRRIVQRQVNLVQYDKSMPIIAVQLYSNGNEYVLPETASAYIRFGKRDHTYVYNECLGCDQTRTIVYFAITDQMTVFYGEHTPIVELRIGDTVAGSGSIPIWIDRNPIQNGDTESKSDLSVFEKAIEAAQKINVKLPTDLKATATNLSLLAGATKIGSGINLSGFEYDEATKTLKASGGGGKNVSPTLVLTDVSGDNPVYKTSLTEEEKTNIEKGLYNSVLYADASAGDAGGFSMYFPEVMSTPVPGNTLFSTFDISIDETAETYAITGASVFFMEIGEKSADGTYPINIQKAFSATFGGGGGGGSSFEEATLSQLSGFKGQYKALHITDCKVVFNFQEIGEITSKSVYFVGFVNTETQLEGTVWTIFSGNPVCLCTGTFYITNGVIDGGHCTMGSLNSVSVGSLLTFGGTRSFNSKDATNAIGLYGVQGCEYAGKVDVVSNGATAKKSALTIISNVNKEATGESAFCEMDGLFEGYGLGRMVLKKDANNSPQFKSFTTWLPPITAADEGKSLVVKNGNGQWATIDTSNCGKLDSANEWSGVNFFNNELHVNQQITDTTGMDFLYAGSDLSSTVVGDSFKRVTGFGCAYPFNDVYAVEGFALVAPDDTSRPTLTFLSVVGKIRWSDLSTGWTPTSYDYQLPKKSGTFALTSDIKATHHHTLTIKEGTKIIFAANRELKSATAATNLNTLISAFAGTTTAGFGDYILLMVDTAAKLKKQDGTEVDLSTLTITIEDIVK